MEPQETQHSGLRATSRTLRDRGGRGVPPTPWSVRVCECSSTVGSWSNDASLAACRARRIARRACAVAPPRMPKSSEGSANASVRQARRTGQVAQMAMASAFDRPRSTKNTAAGWPAQAARRCHAGVTAAMRLTSPRRSGSAAATRSPGSPLQARSIGVPGVALRGRESRSSAGVPTGTDGSGCPADTPLAWGDAERLVPVGTPSGFRTFIWPRFLARSGLASWSVG